MPKKKTEKKESPLFKYLNIINTSSEIPEDFHESEYNAFLTNRGLSYFSDTCLQANAMNRYHFIPKIAQFEYLVMAVRNRKRFSPWYKNLLDEDVRYIREYYKCSPKEAKMYSELLSDREKEDLRTIYGGTSR